MRSKNPCRTKILLNGIFICFLAVSGLNAESTCTKGCPRSDSGILKYTPGNVYEYNFDSLMTVGISNGNEADETALKIAGHAKLYAEGNCGYTLQLDGISVSSVKESIEKQITQSIEKPIHFTMVSGELQPEICADPADTIYALNVKRAIVSLLQVTAEKPHEIDVFGSCPTLSSVSKAGGTEIVTKVRNLNACGHREQISSGLISGVVNEKAGVKSSALLKADYSKEVKLNRGLVEHVQLVEEYKFSPTNSEAGGSGAKAKVKTTLRLANADGQSAAAPPTNAGRPVTIMFEKPDQPAVNNIAALKKVFGQTVSLVDDHVQGDAGQYFTELIRLMRSADVDTLMELSAVPHPNKVLARQVYLDALFRVNTAYAVKAIVRQIPKMSDKEKKIAFLSMNMVQSVDKEALNQAASLLNGNSPKEAYLAVGNLVNKYCKHGGAACDQADVNVVSKKFADSLRHCKANTKKDEDRIVYVLKGVRNTGKIADALTAVIGECAAVAHSARVRVAAIQAFAAASCDQALQQKAIAILRDHNEDSEIRIEAYLAAISCPNAQVANDIAEIVNSETVYQVGGFITSNLKAIRDSTDATREAARYHLGNIRVTKKFPIDPRRYSFNSELSYGIELLGVGASADYNLIYSQHGFLPRSGRLNLTSEVFGTNFNVLELSARQENMENILEYYFGPKGLFRKEPQEILNAITSGGGGAGGRAKRSIADDTAKFGKKYKTYGSKNANDMNLDLSMRLFGSELFFLSLGDNIPESVDDVLKSFSAGLEKTKSTLKNFHNEFACHTLFMDTEFVYPTGVGLPLEVFAQGFAASKMDVAAEINVDAIIEDFRSAKYRLKIVPSVDINVNVQLRFNAHVLTSGLRIASSMHSATGSDVHFELINGPAGFNLDIELPRENLQLIDMKINTDFVIAEQDKEMRVVPLKSSSKKHKSVPQENCFDQLQLFGFTVCYTAVLPETPAITDLTAGGAGAGTSAGGESPHLSGLSLAGPLTLSLSLQSERKFNVKGTYQHLATSQQWKLQYSTPGSKESHNTDITLDLGIRPKLYARAAFDHPQKHLAVETGIRNDAKEFVLYGQHEIDADVTVHKIGFTKLDGEQYRPLIEVSGAGGIRNDINGYRADGIVLVKRSGQKSHYTFENFQIINKDNERVVVNGWVDVGPSSFKSELKIAPGQEAYSVNSHITLDAANGHSVGAFINNDKDPKMVMGGSVFLLLADKHIKGEVIAQAGNVHIHLENDLEYTKNDDKDLISTSKFANALTIKHKGSIAASGKLNGEVAANKFIRIDAEASRLNKKASLAFKLAKDEQNQGDYDLDVLAKLNRHFVDVKAKCELKGSRFAVDNTVATSWGTQLTLKGDIGQRFTMQDIYIDLHGAAQLAAKDKESTWLMKVIGAADKTTSDFKLSRDNADLIVYNGELMHPQDKATTGKINLQLKDVLGAKADFKIGKTGKGELAAMINLKKAGRKVMLDSKFTVAAPKYDIETTISFDSNNNKKLYYKTENIIDKTKFSTKNQLEMAEQKVLFDANGMVKGEWRLNGEIDGRFSLTIPSGRKIDGQFNRKLTTAPKTGNINGGATILLEEQLPSGEGGAKRSIEINGKLEKGNIKTKEYVGETNVVFTSFEGKKQELKFNMKHIPKGQYKMLEYNVASQGDLLKTPLELAFIIDEYCPAHAIFRVTGKCGDLINGNVNGNYYVKRRGEPSTYELQANINVPQSTFKTLALTTSGKYLRPETDDGIHMAELHIDESTSNGGGQSIQLNTVAKGSRTHGSYSFDLNTDRMANPLKLDGSYSHETQEEGKSDDKADAAATGKQKYTFNYSYGSEKFVKNTMSVGYLGGESASLHYNIESSFDAIKSLDLQIRAQKIDDNYIMNTQANHNGQQYGIESTMYTGEHKRGIQMQATFPQGQQPVIVLAVMERLGERKGKLTLEIANIGDLDLKHSAEAAFKSPEDFYIVGQWNSVKLKIDQLDLDVRSSEGGKGISINLKNAQGVIVVGSATYALKREKNKAILEGQGQVQYYQKQSNANFKLIRQVYDMASGDGEIGFSYTFNGTFGPKNAVSTLKITNKNFHAKLSVCEEKKQCTNIEIRSIVSIDTKDLSTAQHDLMILIDLRELGYPHEFELQSKSHRHGLKFQYELESNIISNSNMKYQLVANVQPMHSKIQLKLPSRELLFETQQIFPGQGHILGHYENTAAFYFDKVNKPNEVTRFVANADISGVEKVALNAKGSLKFEHPSIRSLSVSGKFDANRDKHTINTEVVFDIFRVPEQKVIGTMQFTNSNPTTATSGGFNITMKNVLRSAGLGFQYELSGHTALNPEKQEFSSAATLHSAANDLQASSFVFGNKDGFEVLLNGLDEQMINIKGEFNRNKHAAKFESKVRILGSEPIAFSTELEPALVRFSMKYDDLVDANGEIKIGKEATFSIVAKGDKKLYSGRVALDGAHFLSTTYESSEADIEEFMKSVDDKVAEDTKIAREAIEKRFKKVKETVERQIQLAKDSVPDFSQLKDNYSSNMNEIVKELENDPFLKQLIDNYRKLYDTLAKFAGDLAKVAASTYEKIHSTISAFYEKFLVTFKDNILPAWEEFSKKMAAIIIELRVEALRVSKNAINEILTALKTFEPELKAFGKPIAEMLKPLNEAVQEMVKALSHELDELLRELKDYWSKLPTFEAVSAEIKQKLSKLKAVDEVLKFLRDIADHLQQLPGTPESQQLISKLYNYIEAKLKGTKVNDIEILEDLYTSLMNAIRSMWQNWSEVNKSVAGGAAIESMGSGYLWAVPFSLDLIGKVPVWISFKFSLFNFIYNEKLDSLTKGGIATLFRPPYDFLPPFNLKGHIADGQHIFTFDGKHITFPGSCKYILAQDSVDNNFTVMATLKDGKMKSIILIDVGNFVEITDTGALKVNGKPSEYPVHVNDIHVWRRYYTVWMRSQYGVEIICSTDLKVCHVRIDGFYTSKTRGLLGNGNAEPNDDFINVDGTIAENYATFGNGYGLGGNCPPVPFKDYQADQEHDAICTELFGMDSPLLLGYMFLDSSLYREACDHAVGAAGGKDEEAAACNIAMAYASAASMEKVPIRLPSRCIKCAGAAGQREFDAEFNIKTPTNKADVVFVVDVSSSKTIIDNLIAPAISELRNQMKARGITDVQIAVIAFSEQQKYPALLTSNGGKLNYQGQLDQVALSGPVKEEPLDVGIEKVNYFIKLMTGIYDRMTPQSDENAFRMALQYPFRAGAGKSIVAVRSDQLEYGNVFRFIRAHVMTAETKLDGVLLHMIAPVKDLSLEGVPAEKLVGFNSRIVATIEGKDAKKRPKLKYANDMGIDAILNNGGWVFAAQNFQELKGDAEQKAYLNQVTTSIADTLFKTEVVSDCKCVAAHGLHGQHKCVTKSSTFLPNKRPKGSK